MKEIARRTTGKQIQEMKETKNDMRRKNEIEERKKEKVAQAYVHFFFASHLGNLVNWTEILTFTG